MKGPSVGSAVFSLLLSFLTHCTGKDTIVILCAAFPFTTRASKQEARSPLSPLEPAFSLVSSHALHLISYCWILIRSTSQSAYTVTPIALSIHPSLHPFICPSSLPPLFTSMSVE